MLAPEELGPDPLGPDPLGPVAESSSATSTVADSGLRCTVCEYNLTGIAEDRCPECGKPFDRGQLLAILAGAPAPIPIWDDRDRNIVGRFVHMCLLAWFRPIHLSRLLPKNHSAASARRFRWIVLAASLLAVWAAGAMGTDPQQGLVIVAICFLPGLVGITITEAMLAADIGDMVGSRTSTVIRERLAMVGWWRGLLGFLRSFLLLETLVIAAVVGCSPPLDTGQAVTIALAPLLWWWLNILAVLCAQPVSNAEKLKVIVLSPLYVGVAAIVAGVVGYLEVGIIRIVASSLR